MYSFTSPINSQQLQNLHAGDQILLNGTIYTARDTAHQKLSQLIHNKQTLPFDLKDSILYYTGPSPTPPGKIIGSCGPTTSGRMDLYTPLLLEQGVKILIGKGGRSPEVKNALQKNQAIYCATTGGAGALLAKCVLLSTCVAFEELGPEAIYKLEVKNFPLTVINDLNGKDLYTQVLAQNH